MTATHDNVMTKPAILERACVEVSSLEAARLQQWESLDGVINSPPSVVSWEPDRIDIFARGLDNRLWHRWQDVSGWRPWQSFPGLINSQPAAISWGPDRLDVFAVYA